MTSITVAVSTFREGYFDWVVQLLDSLKNQTLKDFEVLLVVNSNHGYFVNLKEMINVKDVPYKIKAFFNPKEMGIAHARNIALKNASTKYIAFTDDDVIPHPDWLKALHQTFTNIDGAGAVTGPVLPHWSPAIQEFSAFFPRELYWIIGCSCLNVDSVKIVRNGFASNLALNRQSAIECGGFNEAFGYNSNNQMVGEEPELCIRLKKMGKPTLWNPESIVFHRITSNKIRLQKLLERSFVEGKSKALLRRALGKEIMAIEVSHFQSVLKAIITTRDLRSKFLLMATTLAVLYGYFRYY